MCSSDLLVASVGVLALLWADAGADRVRAAIAGLDPRWVALACLVQAGGLLLRATRVWAALDGGAPWGLVARGALTANLGHLVVPSRVADLAGSVWIARQAGIPVERGIAAYATAAFLEAVAYASILALTLITAAPVLEGVLTGAQRRDALGGLTILTLAGVAVVAVFLRLLPKRDAPPQVGLQERLRRAAGQARGVLTRPGPLLANLALGAGQIVVMLTVFRCGLEAVGIELAAPWLGGALTMAGGAFGGMVLPPHMGANTSAAATAVLVPFGATAPQALTFGGVLWFAAMAPDVLLGLVGLWLGGGAMWRGDRSPEAGVRSPE